LQKGCFGEIGQEGIMAEPVRIGTTFWERWRVLILLFVVVPVVLAIAMWIMNGINLPSFGGPSGNFSGEVNGFVARSDRSLSVSVSITNDGDEKAKGECTVEAVDRDGLITGVDVVGTPMLAPGETSRGSGVMTIEDHRARFVRRVKINDCGED
jgi:hypothetical protein